MRHCLPGFKERKMQAAFVSAARMVRRVTNTYARIVVDKSSGFCYTCIMGSMEMMEEYHGAAN